MSIENIAPLIEDRRPWPEVEYLFGEDENYSDIVAEIIKNVTYSISSVIQYSETYKKYCQMVNSAIKLDIDKTLSQKTLGNKLKINSKLK